MTPEGQILKAVLDYLAARHVLAFRMNSGAMVGEYEGKKRFMRFGAPGMADVLAFPRHNIKVNDSVTIQDAPVPTWIEVKAANGKQSELQKSFQAKVESEGHRYILVRSIEDLEVAL